MLETRTNLQWVSVCLSSEIKLFSHLLRFLLEQKVLVYVHPIIHLMLHLFDFINSYNLSMCVSHLAIPDINNNPNDLHIGWVRRICSVSEAIKIRRLWISVALLSYYSIALHSVYNGSNKYWTMWIQVTYFTRQKLCILCVLIRLMPILYAFCMPRNYRGFVIVGG